MYILAAQAPYTPDTPKSVLVNGNIVITWDEPDNGGQNILGYTI